MTENNITLTVGDWSGGRHNITKKITIKCDKTVEEIEKFHKIGCTALNIQFEHECEEYEEPSLSQAAIDIIIKHQLVDDLLEYCETPEDMREALSFVDAEFFAHIYMRIAQHGAKLIGKTLNYDMPDQYANNINIGGYGLFVL